MSCARKDYNGWGCWFIRTTIATLMFVAAFAAYTSHNDARPTTNVYEADALGRVWVYEAPTNACILDDPHRGVCIDRNCDGVCE